MTRALRLLLLALLALGPIALAGCSSDTAASASSDNTQVRVVDANEARSLVAGGAQVVDVRTSQEYDAGHLSGAVNVDVQAADFPERVGGLDKSATYVLYCRTGGRAGAAADMMLDMGFTDVVNAGGFDTLAAAGFPTD
jgi:rhodanese-related sulfurtransferase